METKVKYLLDTNIWLERLLDQDNSDLVKKLLNTIPLNQLFISDFSLHSIGVILSKHNKFDVLESFIKDLFYEGNIEQIALEPNDFSEIISNIRKYKLDFDDAYQLSISNKYQMTIVTFDKDFDVDGIRKANPKELV